MSESKHKYAEGWGTLTSHTETNHGRCSCDLFITSDQYHYVRKGVEHGRDECVPEELATFKEQSL